MRWNPVAREVPKTKLVSDIDCKKYLYLSSQMYFILCCYCFILMSCDSIVSKIMIHIPDIYSTVI